MGYSDRTFKYTCPYCARRWFYLRGASSYTVRCPQCGATNTLQPPPEWPDVPREIFLGYDNANQLKSFAVPPEEAAAKWAVPYSVRSFVWQAASHFGRCWYQPETCAPVHGEPTFRDHCTEIIYEPEAEPGSTADCFILRGWATGRSECATWTKICALCQTPSERQFLNNYIRYVKDRQFPRLLPQVRIGIAERRRPDFVVFVPVNYWHYERWAVQLDAAHSEEQAERDKARDLEVGELGYETVSVRPGERGYHEEVRRLIERIEFTMEMAKSDPKEVAIEAKVGHCTSPHSG